MTGAFAVASAFAWRRSRLAFFGLQVIAVSLLPVLYIRVVGENVFAERGLYLPRLGFALLSALLRFAIDRGNVRVAILAAVAGLYATGSMDRTMVWKDSWGSPAPRRAGSPPRSDSTRPR